MTVSLRTVVIGLAISFLLLQPATAIECQDAFVKGVTGDGEILVTLSGAVYRVFPGDTIYSFLWLPATALVICERTGNIKGRNVRYYEIINRDDGEKVLATRLR
jgi:hypothetical protein